MNSDADRRAPLSAPQAPSGFFSLPSSFQNVLSSPLYLYPPLSPRSNSLESSLMAAISSYRRIRSCLLSSTSSLPISPHLPPTNPRLNRVPNLPSPPTSETSSSVSVLPLPIPAASQPTPSHFCFSLLCAGPLYWIEHCYDFGLWDNR